MYDMKPKNKCKDAELFLTRLRENSSFRKAVCGMSAQEGLQRTLHSKGFDFDAYELIKAMAELLERESEESEQQNYSIIRQM